MYPFERFTEPAKKVLTFAQQEAEVAGHSYIGTEHLLLGILRVPEGLGGAVLKALGAELEAARTAIAAVLQGGAHVRSREIIPTARVKKVIELSFETARRMGHVYVGTEHLLLGLLTEGEGVAARVLLDTGVTLDRAREETERLIAERGSEQAGDRVEGQVATTRPMGPELMRLLQSAGRLAAERDSTFTGLDHLLDAMISAAGIEALARLLDVRRHSAAKEQAIASQEYDAAAGHRAAERQARQALDQAVAAWRQELAPPEKES